MKKLLLILLLSLGFTGSSWSLSIDPPDYILICKTADAVLPESTDEAIFFWESPLSPHCIETIESYNDNGQLIKVTERNWDDVIIKETIYEYENTLLSKVTLFFYEEIVQESVYEYKNTQLSKVTERNWDGVIIKETIYEYENNKLSKEIERYYENTLLSKVIERNGNGVIVNKFFYLYENGQIIKMNVLNGGYFGTGFYINNSGYLVTNQRKIDTKDNNVIDKCSSVWVKDGNNQTLAKVMEQDTDLDIAVLKVNKVTNNFARFGEIGVGEDIMALGFPANDMLGDELKATNGNVSSLSDKNFLQFISPINIGSGGPLLNKKGLLVGVTKATVKSIPKAVKGSTLQNFLGKHGIHFEVGEVDKTLSGADILEVGEKFTVMVMCYQ